MIHGASSVEKEITASASVPEVPSKSGNDDRRFFSHHPDLRYVRAPFAQNTTDGLTESDRLLAEGF